MGYFRSSMEPVHQCLTDSGLANSAIAEVVLVGGSTRIPKVQSMVSGCLGEKSWARMSPPMGRSRMELPYRPPL